MFQILESALLILRIIWPFLVVALVLKLIPKLIKKYRQKKKTDEKQIQKTHEKQLKKLDKVYGTYTIAKIDKMTGQEFELFVEKLFRVLEKDKILKTEFTPTTGDQGCDLIVHYPNGDKLGIQCKRYAKSVGNKAVQNIVTAKPLYGLTRLMVFTNNYLTPSAQEAAKAHKVELVDRDILAKKLAKYNEIIRALHTKK
jgi:HJR/Mrr/RecB family endonuclease